MSDEIDRIVALATDVIAHFEGFSSTPYTCPAGHKTIGYGETHFSTELKHITEDQAKQRLTKKVQEIFESLHLELCKKQLEYTNCIVDYNILILNKWQNIALIDFIYNLGWAKFLSSTLYKYIIINKFYIKRCASAPDGIKVTVIPSIADICNEFTRWVYATKTNPKNGVKYKVKLPGLIIRRMFESKCYSLDEQNLKEDRIVLKELLSRLTDADNNGEKNEYSK